MAIPNILHFIYGLSPDFGGMPFSFVHYLAIESARVLNRPERIYFYCAYEPDTEWFERIRPRIEVVRVDAPSTIFGRPIQGYAHRSDVVRLEVLREYGGIYMDLDTISLKPFSPLLATHDFVIGAQLLPGFRGYLHGMKRALSKVRLYPWQRLAVWGLGNSVMMASRTSEFLHDWYAAYANYDEAHGSWDQHSVVVPWELYRTGRYNVHALSPYEMLYPLWDDAGLRALFEQNRVYAKAYVHHLWESKSWEPYLRHISPASINTHQTTYNHAALSVWRKVAAPVRGDPQAISPT